MKYLIIAGLLISVSFRCEAQNELLSFSGVQVSDHVQLTFTMRAGITCNGLVIEHSSSPAGFTEAGNIPGVCGSASEDLTYTFNDNMPLVNGVNYYRLNLGNLGYSDVIQVDFFRYDENGIVVFPNPATDEAVIYFLNPAKGEHTVMIYDATGKRKKKFITRADKIRLERGSFNSGVFFIEIFRNSDRKIVGTAKVVF